MIAEGTYEQVRQMLLEAGWTEDGLLEGPTIYAQEKVMRPDIILSHNLYPMAVVEIKRPSDNPLALTAAADQAADYAKAINVPFAYATDGSGIVELRLAEGEENWITSFPSPSSLWSLLGREWDEGDPRLFPPYRDSALALMPHQVEAVSKIVEAVVNGKKKVLVSMATGTGMSYVAFQVSWKLIQSGFCQRMLYLTDRVELSHAAQAVFRSFGESLLVRTASSSQTISSEEQRAHRVHISTVAALMNPRDAPRFQSLPSDFYDLIIVQNAEHQSVVPIVEYFEQAIVVGFTSRDVPGLKTRQLYGQPVSTYTMEEALAVEDAFEVPEGFEQARLGEIAELRLGVMAPRKETTEEPGDKRVYAISARDIRSDGSIDLSQLSWSSLGAQSNEADDFLASFLSLEDDISERFSIQEDDILLARSFSGSDVRVGLVEDDFPDSIFSSSLIRIRVDPEVADPQDVFAYLRSDVGRLTVRRFASTVGTRFAQVSIRELSKLPVLLPTTPRARESAEEKLGAVSMTKEHLQREVLPLMEELEGEEDRGSEDYDQRQVLIATRLRDLADILAPPKLAERVMTYYPTPVALAYRRFHDARFNVYEQVLRLKDVFEAAAFYVYNIALADLLRRLDPRTYYISDAGARRAYNGYSMTTRMDFVAELQGIAQLNQGKDLFMRELADSLVPALAKDLQDDLRNRLSHTATAAESQQRQVIEDFEPLVESMLSDLDFLSRYQLVRVTSYFYEGTKLVRQMEVYQGVVPELDEQFLSSDTELTVADRNHLVLLDPDGRVLDLYPLYQLVASEETRHENHLCFLKQRKAGQELLEGESVQGAFGLSLPGFEDFEILQARILSLPPEE